MGISTPQPPNTQVNTHEDSLTRNYLKDTLKRETLKKEKEENGRFPNFILELTSRSTANNDKKEKYNLYQRLGVQEYFLFDPKNECLRPPLWGFRLENGHYKRLEFIGNRLYSEQLGLEFVLTEKQKQE